VNVFGGRERERGRLQMVVRGERRLVVGREKKKRKKRIKILGFIF
jgi:hypothetical protein